MQRNVRLAHPCRENFRLARSYKGFRRTPLHALRFVIFNREIDNFTYSISNTEELAQVLADALGYDVAQTRAVIRELEADHELRWKLESRLRYGEIGIRRWTTADGSAGMRYCD